MYKIPLHGKEIARSLCVFFCAHPVRGFRDVLTTRHLGNRSSNKVRERLARRLVHETNDTWVSKITVGGVKKNAKELGKLREREREVCALNL